MAKTWQALRVVVGIVLIVVGLVGVLVPLIPGIPLLLAGVAVIGSEHPMVRRITSRLRRCRVRPRRRSGGER